MSYHDFVGCERQDQYDAEDEPEPFMNIITAPKPTIKTAAEFQSFPKMPRLSRECVITEKIDGTNAQIYIGMDGEFLVGSRNRWITPEKDNFGFARWAYEHREQLFELGAGRHYGEWWGAGIQRGYGLLGSDKRFSLFNVSRWNKNNVPACCGVVPVLYRGPFDTWVIDELCSWLVAHGSVAAPGFMNPEGIIVHHSAANHGFKKTLVDDEKPKGVA